MNKFIKTIILSIAVFLPSVAHAANGQLVSGPSGNIVNGWYSSRPFVRVNTIPNCPSGPSGNIDMILINEEGQHTITLRSHLNGYPRIYRDDDTGGRGTTSEVFSCPSIDTPYTGEDPVIFWQGSIKWDATAPKVSISSPSNNSNTGNSTVQVSGSVSDSTSGVWTVSINGVNASISGGNYSANVPVSLGLNTLNVVAKDFAGNASQAQVVVNRISTAQSNNSTSKTGEAGGQGGNSSSDKAGSEASAEQNNGSEKNATPTIVKGVVQGGGIGLATILGFVIVLLLLDKFRVIEIKAFHRISSKNSKSPAVKRKKIIKSKK